MQSPNLEQLSQALQTSGFLHSGAVTEATERPHQANATLSTLMALELTYSADASGPRPAHCLLKRVAPEMFRIGKAEADFYRWVASQANKPAVIATCYGTIVDEAQSLAAILIEDRGVAHEQPEWPLAAQLPQCSASVQTVAQVHGRWWGSDQLASVAQARPAPQQDKQRLATCSQALIDRLGDALSPARRALMEQVVTQYPDLHQQRLTAAGTATIVHGDAHLWNFHFAEPQPGLPEGLPALLDWQLWGVDFGVADLAYMLALHWFPERRARFEGQLLEQYVEALQAQDIDYSSVVANSDYRFMVAGLLTKVAIYASVLPANIWWPHLERAFLSFDDLDCAEFFSH